ncbi:bicaudal-D-related protein 2-like [Notolabrus celidotus]|uniref:bicaudal-D-related protein 2-like n=1 Tax=Notolabrus celidotus TaxID=1203425 RepID=UPI00149066E7|nr:bicaudal-D-related protein 2-like [Notolabrus celidotus]
MDFSQSFSMLNEQLRPRNTTSQQLYSSLNRLEDKQWSSLRSQTSSYRSTILPTDPKSSDTAEPEDPREHEEAVDLEDFSSGDLDETDSGGLSLFNNSQLLTDLNLKDEDDLPDTDSSSTSPSEEKDIPGELALKVASESTESVDRESERSSLQRSYIDGTLPDLIRSGRPLGRRRTLGHSPVSDTLKEVRREVELSRRRSIKLKAQVDKLQESREGPGWSQHRERVTEEVMSILRLLHPLTESESSLPNPSSGQNQLDHALGQLQNVARKLAISHTAQSPSRKGAEDSALLQQALRDRDEAIEKKKAMEEELLRSKTEMMMLNNQVLEAVQKRLEMSLELEAWKEDVQLMLHQQLQMQQQAEQAQKKPSRLGLLRRTNKQPIQRPATYSKATAVPPITIPNQIYISKSAASTPSTSPTQRTWRDRLRRGKSSRPGDQDASGQDSDTGKGDDFEVVSLD